MIRKGISDDKILQIRSNIDAKIKEAKLLDAGYSKEKARKGAKWLIKNGFNIDWNDNNLFYNEVSKYE